jgi:LysM repeat protein
MVIRRLVIRLVILFVLAAAAGLSAQFTHAQTDVTRHTVAEGETLFRIAMRYGTTPEAIMAANGIGDARSIQIGQELIIPGVNGTEYANSDTNSGTNSEPASTATLESATAAPTEAPNTPQPTAEDATATFAVTSAVTNTPTPMIHTVAAGDTLNRIATRYGVTVEAIIRANGLANPDALALGQELVIPGVAGLPPGVTPTATTISLPDIPTETPMGPLRPTQDPKALEDMQEHVVQRGEGLSAIATKYGLSWEAIAAANNIQNPDLIFPGAVLRIPNEDLPEPGDYMPVPPPAPSPTGKHILVILSEQRVYAYEDGVMLRTILGSTGLPATPTVQGEYAVYIKYEAQLMTGPGYYLPDVPFVLYFYQGYALHGAYWHSNWGNPMSHGCVNLPPEQARWLYHWSEIGTPVTVRW